MALQAGGQSSDGASEQRSRHSAGWIGLGRMGYELAKILAQSGVDTAGYNRTRSKAESLTEFGVTLVDRPAALAGRDIVFTMVSTGEDLNQVLFGSDGLLSNPNQVPSILVDCSTISAEESQDIREAALALGTEMLVVPVSGNDVVARARKLNIFASGPRPAFETVKPYLECFGPTVTYVGEGDTARIVKIGHNMLLGIMFQGLAETTVFAEKLGIPRHVYLEVINNSVLGSTFSRYKSPGVINLDFTVTFTNALLGKDLDLGLEAAADRGVALPLTEVVKSLVQNALDAGEGERDYTTLFLQMAEAAKLAVASEHMQVSDGLG